MEFPSKAIKNFKDKLRVLLCCNMNGSGNCTIDNRIFF